MRFFKDFICLFFPKICVCCENILLEHEKSVCLTCTFKMAKANIANVENNVLTDVFSNLPITTASTHLFFRKEGLVKSLIHALKYKNQQEIGEIIASWALPTIKKQHKVLSIDAIIKVPLHPKKRAKERL